ncbi:MAG: hypothetical protein ACE5WD_14140 [Candidatus Aminicenantia bacterium]
MEHLDLHLLDKIEPRKKKLFNEHVKKCPECKKELERDIIYWTIWGFLLPFIFIMISLAVSGLSGKILKIISQVETKISSLTLPQILIFNLGIASSFLAYSFWQAYKLLKDRPKKPV